MIKSNKKLLIIWDFDGVIADSEKLWVYAWRTLLENEKNLFFSDEQARYYLMGLSDKTRIQRLTKDFPNLVIDNSFLKKLHDDEVELGDKYLQTTPGVEAIFADTRFDHCIATGAQKKQHLWKISHFPWLSKYLKNRDHFTNDMVEQGKPEPDIFLLAAKTKGYPKENCIVIGDSLNDIMAAKTAGMKCIVFVGGEGMDTPEYRQKCHEAGVDFICSKMDEVHKILRQIIKD